MYVIILVLIIILLFYILSIFNSGRFERSRTKFLRNDINGRNLFEFLDRDTDVAVSRYNIARSNGGVVKYLGRGSYGKVYMYVDDNAVSAYKVFKRVSEHEWNMLCKIRERILNECKERSREMIDKMGNDLRLCPIYSIDKTKMCIHMQYINGGTLTDFINGVSIKRPHYYVELVKVIVYNIMAGVHMLHKVCGVIHLDIKPDNIVFIDNPLEERDLKKRLLKCANLRIIDYGFCEDINNHSIVSKGSFITMAPELILHKRISANVLYDSWSVGCVLFKLYFGRYPIEGTKNEMIATHSVIRKNSYGFISMIVENTEHDLKLRRLLLDALWPDIRYRKSVGALLNYAWFDSIPFYCVPNRLFRYGDVNRLDLNVKGTNEYLREHAI